MSTTVGPKGEPLYLKDNAWASKWFNTETFRRSPKSKFNFLCILDPVRGVMKESLYKDSLNIAHQVKAADSPKPSFDVEVVDQYNKRRVIQKKLSWDPITVVFHDDMDNQLYQILVDYMQYYYADFRNSNKTDWNLDTVTNLINDFDWGYKPHATKYYFNNIALIWLAGGRATNIIIQNPLITNIAFDNLDYSDGTTPLEIAVTFEYEGVRIGSINAELFQPDSPELIRPDLFKAQFLTQTVSDIGNPFDDIRFSPAAEVPGLDRSPGLGELFQAGATFYGKHNNKPTVKNLIDDLILRPAKGNLSSSINSWGNFSFGGIGSAKSPGLLGTVGSVVGNQVGDVFKVANSGTAMQDIFKFGSGGSSGG